MIDEYYTWIIFGYHSDELYSGSHEHVVAVCDECGIYRSIRISAYRDLCRSCANKMCKPRRPRTEEMRRAVSIKMTGKKKPPRTDEWRRNHSIAMTGKKMPPCTDKTRRKISAGKQGIPYEEWDGFAKENQYCELFDEACRERIRAKYNHLCFLCDKHQDENITKDDKQRKLAVHHADKNRGQGCDGIVWKLVPLCMSCHGKSHYEPVQSRIEYILADEE